MKTRILLIAALFTFSISAQASTTQESTATSLYSWVDIFFPTSCEANPKCRDEDDD